MAAGAAAASASTVLPLRRRGSTLKPQQQQQQQVVFPSPSSRRKTVPQDQRAQRQGRKQQQHGSPRQGARPKPSKGRGLSPDISLESLIDRSLAKGWRGGRRPSSAQRSTIPAGTVGGLSLQQQHQQQRLLLLLDAQREYAPQASQTDLASQASPSSKSPSPLAASGERMLLADYPQQPGAQQRTGGPSGIGSQSTVSCQAALLGQKGQRFSAAAVAEPMRFGGMRNDGEPGSTNTNGLTDLWGIWGQQHAAPLCGDGEVQAPQMVLGGPPRHEETGGTAARQNEWGWGQPPLFFHQPAPPTW